MPPESTLNLETAPPSETAPAADPSLGAEMLPAAPLSPRGAAPTSLPPPVQPVLPSEAPRPLPDDMIRVRGARVHNLNNIDLDIPRDQLVVITGVSGSGKSSLAFDTLFAEGQRQYLESLSAYARQFLHQLERPDVDSIEGLPPTISIDQRSGSSNPRSTVATLTEVYDYLRLMMARLGEPQCFHCGTPIRQQSAEDIVEQLLALEPGTKVMILAPFVRGKKGAHAEVFTAIRKAGFIRVRVDGEIVDVEHHGEISPRKAHTIEAVVDRIVIREGVEERVSESVDLAVKHGEGVVQIAWFERENDESSEGVWHEQLHSTLFACPNCKISYEELEPRTFSFNSPYGACPACEGLGTRIEFDPDLVAPDLSLSLAAGAILPWKGGTAPLEQERLKAIKPFLTANHLAGETPLSEWPEAKRLQFFRGDGGTFPGLITLLEKEFATTTDPDALERFALFRGTVVCAACGGSRLRPEARSVRLAGKAIHEITRLTVRQAREFFQTLRFPREEQPIARPLLEEIAKRLTFLDKVGVEYLSLDRPADTLSGGELQRVRLASGIGSGLVGACYILDEPSIGLHPRDNERLIEALRDLHGLGNTVLIVEHDEAMMRTADFLIDIGPGAGRLGGHVVAQGTPAAVAHSDSLTGKYLAGELQIAPPALRRKIAKTRSLTLEGATTNNLKNITVRFPLSALVCVTGVSGSGKSSLTNETLARAIRRRLTSLGPKPGPFVSLRGVSQIDKLVEVDQSPIGRTPRSNPATYTGVFDEVRKVFAGTKAAKQLGFKAGRFSFNAKGGRCETCQGHGARKIEMNFLPDLFVPCEECEGRRFNRQTLQVRYKEKNIAEVLDLRIDEAAAFFENFPAIRRLLSSLQEVGLGYLTLGQSATTLSGGEAQRIKLAAELARVDTGQTLYLLDEPTTGLHFDDVRKLLIVLQRLVDLGNTVIVIEHNLDVMKSVDWIIDLGPEGGERGGELVAEGTPEEIAALGDSHTGRFLRAALTSD
ncbi:MAG TPA: excinuclease ABC subunit UvrA [Pirellulales bacterium]|jgi:excinuclease ABC subunit A|nr:excinuclease ABC subunit UvrA [Pirellulales bacterium]